MSYLDRIKHCTEFEPKNYLPFFLDDLQIGQVSHLFVDHLAKFSNLLKIKPRRITFTPPSNTFNARTCAMEHIATTLRADGLIKGWRDESYPVGASFGSLPLLKIERAAAPFFGIRAYGVHLNGYTKKGNKTYLWVGKRSKKKQTGPGQLDQIVAGGQPVGISLKDNLVKECFEEANIPKRLALKAQSVGIISYLTQRQEGLRDDVLFCFDILLPNQFKPYSGDGEVEAFFLWPIERIAEIIQTTDKFKFNSALVIIDFLIRHGFIDASHQDYIKIIDGLHRNHSPD